MDLETSSYQPVFIVQIEIPESGRWHRVFVGLFEDRESALQAAREYNETGIFEYIEPRMLNTPRREREELAVEEISQAMSISSGGARDE
jgi:hypothetical protein